MLLSSAIRCIKSYWLGKATCIRLQTWCYQKSHCLMKWNTYDSDVRIKGIFVCFTIPTITSTSDYFQWYDTESYDAVGIINGRRKANLWDGTHEEMSIVWPPIWENRLDRKKSTPQYRTNPYIIRSFHVTKCSEQ